METRRFLIAIALSIAVFIIWGYFFPPEPRPARPAEVASPAPAVESRPADAPPIAAPREAEPTAARTATADAARSAAESEISAPEVVQADRERAVVIEAESYRAELSNRGGQLMSLRLRHHARTDGEPLDLVRARVGSTPYPFGLVEEDGTPSALNEALFLVERTEGGGREEVTFRYRGPAGEATKRFSFGEDGLFEVEIVLAERSGQSVFLGPGVRNPSAEELENRFARKSAIYRTSEDTERLDPNSKSEGEIVPGNDLKWVGLQDRYFLTALVLEEPVDRVSIQPVLAEPANGGMAYRPRPEELSDEEEDLVREMTVLVRPQGGHLSGVSYWGPKVYDDLAAQGYGLEKSVELGPFGFLARPLLYGLRWIHDNVVNNYGWAIILMTLAIRIVLFPLNHKSVVSMQRMQDVNPKIQAIRQKYRSKLKDKQGRPNAEMQRKQNEEIMALYKKEGINPAGGCLPLLLQIPVLFAFYSLLSTAIELRLAPWTGWIHDLSAPDPILVLPIVMGATQFLQQKLTPSSADPAQRRIFMLMPIFFTILFLGFPSGLVLYWLTNNVLGIVQQVAYKRIKDKKAEA